MSKKANNNNLSKEQQKQINSAVSKAKGDKKQMSAQDSIPFQRMFKDGICRVTDNFYSKTVKFLDINYQLNNNEDKNAIFDAWCDFLNYFDSSVKFQLSFMNMTGAKETYSENISIPVRGDMFDGIAIEYQTFLRDQLAKGNNGLIKTKYLTFGIEAESLKIAKPRLERIESDILTNFKKMGVVAEPINGYERLKLMHGMFIWMKKSRSVFRGMILFLRVFPLRTT